MYEVCSCHLRSASSVIFAQAHGLMLILLYCMQFYRVSPEALVRVSGDIESYLAGHLAVLAQYHSKTRVVCVRNRNFGFWFPALGRCGCRSPQYTCQKYFLLLMQNCTYHFVCIVNISVGELRNFVVIRFFRFEPVKIHY